MLSSLRTWRVSIERSGVCLYFRQEEPLQALCELLEAWGRDVAMLTGDTAAAERKRIVEASTPVHPVLVATGN